MLFHMCRYLVGFVSQARILLCSGSHFIRLSYFSGRVYFANTCIMSVRAKHVPPMKNDSWADRLSKQQFRGSRVVSAAGLRSKGSGNRCVSHAQSHTGVCIMRMYVYIYIYIHTHVNAYMCVYIYIYIYISLSLSIYIYIYIYIMYTHMYTHTHIP